MSIRDITGIFSRFFITGFYFPAFFTLFALWISVSDELPPEDFERESSQTQLLILGGLALPIGLGLLGVRMPVFRFFEGYPLEARPLGPALKWLQRRSRRRIARKNPESVGTQWRLDRLFPREESRLIPTRLGNVFRAAEDHAYIRWGLDHIAVWPRIDPLLNEREQELHANARSDAYFFLNSALGAVAAGAVLIADEIAHERLSGYWLLLYVVPFVVAYLLYRMAIGAAEGWGLEMRASVDLHRLELYEKLGVRRPASSSVERGTTGPALNAFLLRGEPLPAAVWDTGAALQGAQGGTMSQVPAEVDASRRREVLAQEASPGAPREPDRTSEGSPGEPREDPPPVPTPQPSPGEPSPGEPREGSPGSPREEPPPFPPGEPSPGEPREPTPPSNT